MSDEIRGPSASDGPTGFDAQTLTHSRAQLFCRSMFSIIGGDGKEYGPVTSEQIRAWIEPVTLLVTSVGSASIHARICHS